MPVRICNLNKKYLISINHSMYGFPASPPPPPKVFINVFVHKLFRISFSKDSVLMLHCISKCLSHINVCLPPPPPPFSSYYIWVHALFLYVLKTHTVNTSLSAGNTSRLKRVLLFLKEKQIIPTCPKGLFIWIWKQFVFFCTDMSWYRV